MKSLAFLLFSASCLALPGPKGSAPPTKSIATNATAVHQADVAPAASSGVTTTYGGGTIFANTNFIFTTTQFVVPHIQPGNTGNPQYSNFAWTGIQGGPDGIAQAGVKWTIDSSINGGTPFYQYFIFNGSPSGQYTGYYPTDVPLNPGDTIQVTITIASDGMSYTVILKNVSQNKLGVYNKSLPAKFSAGSVNFTVERIIAPNVGVPNFGNFVFTNSYAEDATGARYNANQATAQNIVTNGHLRGRGSITGQNSIAVQYVPY